MQTLFIGKNIIFLPEVESTNSYAIELLKNVNIPEGTVVNAAYQTHGKGQRQNVWQSLPQSNVTISIILKPFFLPLENQFFLYMIAALACYDTTAELLSFSHFDIKIKWPNDILVNKKKIAGILIENKLSNNTITHCVIGIGLNVNQTEFSGQLPTSLKLLGATGISTDQVLERLCYYVEHYYLKLKNFKLQSLREKYHENLFGLDQQLAFKVGAETKSFAVRGVGQSGLLMLQDPTGQMHEADVKDVTWLIQ